MAKITQIYKDSTLYGLLNIGDEVLKFDENDFVDILDYIYADSKNEVTLTVKIKGKEETILYKKQYDEDTLGLEFDSSVEIKPIECINNCIFCFVKQLPKGMRNTLYVRDDDYRLSFISGCYITCTNLKEKDIERILKYKLSPLYVSVHATDESIRKFMLGVKNVPNQMEILDRFIRAGIKIHTQIVMVAGINDGSVLEKSLNDLYKVGATSVAVVPVGLTSHRQSLTHIEAVKKDQALSAIETVEAFYEEHNGFCYCSDEMYQIAEKSVPNAEYYGNFDQIENGVGLIAKFLTEFNDALSDFSKGLRGEIGIFTGISGESTMKKAKEIVENVYPKLHINIYTVKNRFFGESVTVTGLVTAGDIIEQYGNKKFDEKFLLIPSVMLKEFESVFLDNVSVKELSKKLRKKIIVSSTTGKGFLNGLRGRRR